MKCLEMARLKAFAPNTHGLLRVAQGPKTPCCEMRASRCVSTIPPLEIPAYGPASHSATPDLTNPDQISIYLKLSSLSEKKNPNLFDNVMSFNSNLIPLLHILLTDNYDLDVLTLQSPFCIMSSYNFHFHRVIPKTDRFRDLWNGLRTSMGASNKF